MTQNCVNWSLPNSVSRNAILLEEELIQYRPYV